MSIVMTDPGLTSGWVIIWFLSKEAPETWNLQLVSVFFNGFTNLRLITVGLLAITLRGT